MTNPVTNRKPKLVETFVLVLLFCSTTTQQKYLEKINNRTPTLLFTNKIVDTFSLSFYLYTKIPQYLYISNHEAMRQLDNNKYTQSKILKPIKTMIICLVIGMFAGFLQGFNIFGETLKMLFPGLLFGLALPISNWKLYKRPWMTLIGFFIVSTAIYPMMIILSMRFFGEEIGANMINKIPILLGIIPSLGGAGLLYLVYRTFLGKKDHGFWMIYFGIAILIGIIFFPLMNFANNFVLSLGIWQAGIGFGLTHLHFINK